MDDLLTEFIAETREMLEALAGELVAWEAAPDDRDRLDAIFRFVHTVKGNCGFFDFPRLEALSHVAEDALGEVRAGRRLPDETLVSAVLAIIDRIGALTDAVESGEEISEEGDSALIAALAHDLDKAEAAALAKPVSDSDSKVRNGTARRSIRLPVELLDRMMIGVSDLVLARNDLARVLREVGNDPRLDGPFERMTAILDDVRDAATRMRMQRIEFLFSALPRLVRDLGQELGKQVMVDLEGQDVELDREMIESIRDPLTHIIRNAIDHGLETPSERLRAGKREIGVVAISARQAGNQIYLVISDDGRGIDADRLVQNALEAGIVDEDDIAGMSLDEKYALIFSPGLSTAKKVTSISGRGVGMDVVQSNIQKIGGTIAVNSNPGEGTTILIRLPLTLSIIATLTVTIGGQRFALPRSGVEEVIHGADPDLGYTELGDGCFIDFRGVRIPCIDLAEVLGLETGLAMEERTFIVVRYSPTELSAVIVDKVLDHEEAVIKPVAPAITATRLYTGATLLSDGTPVLAIDLTSIAIDRDFVSEGGSRAAAVNVDDGEAIEADEAMKVMLFIDHDGQQRAAEMDRVERIETIQSSSIERHAGASRAVIDGRLRTLGGLDDRAVETDKIRLLRLSEGDHEAFVAVRAIIDVAPVEGDIKEGADGPLTKGYVVVGGRAMPLLDVAGAVARWGDPINQEVR